MKKGVAITGMGIISSIGNKKSFILSTDLRGSEYLFSNGSSIKASKFLLMNPVNINGTSNPK